MSWASLPTISPPVEGATRCEHCGHWTVPRPVCVCGDGLASHNIETVKKPCSRSACDCGAYREKEAV